MHAGTPTTSPQSTIHFTAGTVPPHIHHSCRPTTYTPFMSSHHIYTIHVVPPHIHHSCLHRPTTYTPFMSPWSTSPMSRVRVRVRPPRLCLGFRVVLMGPSAYMRTCIVLLAKTMPSICTCGAMPPLPCTYGIHHHCPAPLTGRGACLGACLSRFRTVLGICFKPGAMRLSKYRCLCPS